MNDCLIRKKNDKGYIGENIYLSLLIYLALILFSIPQSGHLYLYFKEIAASKKLLILSSFTSHRAQ